MKHIDAPRSTRLSGLGRIVAITLFALACVSIPGIARALPAQDLPSGTPTLPSPTSWPLSPRPEVLQGFDLPDEKWGAGNRGLDLVAAQGDPVLAVADGTVSFAGQIGGRGVVVVTHGAVRTTYTPVAVEVSTGQPVARGTRLGTVAGQHCAATSCLHLGLLHGEEYLDPALLFRTAAGAVPTGPVRLVPNSVLDQVRQRAAERAAAAAAAIAAGATGQHGFLLPASGPVTSPYGMRQHPVTGVFKLHDGTDIGAACGTPLVAAAAGTVTTVDLNPALGRRVIIDHGTVDGHHVVTAVNHASDQTVTVGEQVAAGQLIGHVGSTGLSTGCHLHLMLWLDGQLTDPLTWF